MFTGIIADIGEVLSVEQHDRSLHRLRIACGYARASIALGASIACSGVCLTVTGTGEEGGRTWFSVDAAAETLALTTVGRWKAGTRINLERSLKVGDELGGHLVAGHVDGLASLLARHDLTDSAKLVFTAPNDLMRFIAIKGSVALDGVSLTVNEVDDKGAFSVLIVPHTLKVTTLGALRAFDTVNLEIDTMARYAARLAQTRERP